MTSTAGTARLPLVRGRAIVFLGIVLVSLGLRSAATAVSPILGSIEKDVPFHEFSIGLLGTLAPFAFAVIGAITPFIARRWGLDWTTFVASALIGVGEIGRALTHDSGWFLTWSFVSLAGTGAANVMLPPLVKKYFPDRIGPMSTIYLFLAVVGSVVPAYLAAPLAEGISWRVSIASWGAIAVVAVIPWLMQALRSRTPGNSAPQPVSSDRAITKRVWSSSAAWALAVSFGIASVNCYIMWAWLPLILHDRLGMSEADAGTQLALYTAMAIPNSLIVPMLIVRMRSMTPFILWGMGVIIVGALGLWFIPGVLTWLWVSLSGFGIIFFSITLLLINLRTTSPAGAVALSGMTQGVGYLIGALGPLAVGFIHGATSDWTWAFVLIIVSALAGIFPLVLLRKPVMVDAQREVPTGA